MKQLVFTHISLKQINTQWSELSVSNNTKLNPFLHQLQSGAHLQSLNLQLYGPFLMECSYFEPSSQSQNWYMYIYRYIHAKVEGKAFTLNYNESHLVRMYLAVRVAVSSCAMCLCFKGAVSLEWSSIDGWCHTLLIPKLAEVWNRQLRGEFSYVGFNVLTSLAFQLVSTKEKQNKAKKTWHERRHVISACFWDSAGHVSRERSLYGTCQRSMRLEGEQALTICGTAPHCH